MVNKKNSAFSFLSGSADHLLVPDDSNKQSISRRNSDSHLSAFLRGDINLDVVPDFCDTSFFQTIVSHAKKQPTKPKEPKQSALKSLQVRFLLT